jgi:arginine-tRNA-protein transferase
MTTHEPNQHPSTGLSEQLEQYFVDISTECPYGLPKRAMYHQALLGPLDASTMGMLLARGYRRNGNCMYCMRCPECTACVPIRLDPQSFVPNRNQRRVWKKNLDVTVGVAPLTMSDENLALLDRFLRTRFPEGRSGAESYYSGFFITTITRCFELRYRVADKLIGVAILDGSDQWLNAVYFYFDPDEAKRSPGTLNILHLINFCTSHHITPLYLGYWIETVQAMQYKSSYKPHEILLDGRWQQISRSGRCR